MSMMSTTRTMSNLFCFLNLKNRITLKLTINISSIFLYPQSTSLVLRSLLIFSATLLWQQWDSSPPSPSTHRHRLPDLVVEISPTTKRRARKKQKLRTVGAGRLFLPLSFPIRTVRLPFLFPLYHLSKPQYRIKSPEKRSSSSFVVSEARVAILKLRFRRWSLRPTVETGMV